MGVGDGLVAADVVGPGETDGDGVAAATNAGDALGWIDTGDALGSIDAADGGGVVAVESQAATTPTIRSNRIIR